jgi:hypothetical protein
MIITLIGSLHYGRKTCVLQKGDKFLNRHFRLNNNGFRCFRRQIAAVPWDYDVQMRFNFVTEICMAACLMVDVEARFQ